MVIDGACLTDEGPVEQLSMMLTVQPVAPPGHPGERGRRLYLTAIWPGQLIQAFRPCVRAHVDVPKVSVASGARGWHTAHSTKCPTTDAVGKATACRESTSASSELFAASGVTGQSFFDYSPNVSR